jgi:hypothetical protein
MVIEMNTFFEHTDIPNGERQSVSIETDRF